MMRYRNLLIVCFGLLPFLVKADTDTLSITIQEADKMFLQNNLSLLASQYNITVQQAQAIQAKLYPNPVFSAELNAYDPDNNKAFHIGKDGQKVFGVEQLIILGGKRKSEIEMAKQNSEIASLEFEDLIRNLRFQLHSSLYTVKQQQVVLRKYKDQLQLLDTIISNYELQVQKGNIPVKEIVRLKSAYLQVNNERSVLLSEYNEEIARLKILLHTTSYIHPVIPEASFEKFTTAPLLDYLYETAMANRPDVKIASLQSTQASLYYKYQKQQNIPDVALNATYDQRGGAFNNQVNAGLNFALPLWNRNKGNIQAARGQIKIAEIGQQQKKEEVYTEVATAYNTLQRSISEYAKSKNLYNSDFEVVLNGVSDNFRKRNISLIEFIDFIQSYNDAMEELQRIKTMLAISGERINYLTTSEVY